MSGKCRSLVRRCGHALGAAALVALPACSGGGSSGPASSIEGIALSARVAGDTAIEFVLTTDDSRLLDVELYFSRDEGESWELAIVKSGAVTLLASSPTGVRHTIIWDSIGDVGFRDLEDELRVRVRVVGGEFVSTAPAAAEIEPPSAGATVENVEVAARRIENYMIYFGGFDDARTRVAETHDLVILFPCEPTVTRVVIADIQDGVDAQDPRDDVLVVGYLNVGEDERTIGVSDTDLLVDARFVGDGSGPRVDPRGPGAAGSSLTGLDPLGLASVSGGYASWYLDDNSIESSGVGDGMPDRNGNTGACFTNLGDPSWHATLDTMLCDSVDGLAGIREILSLDFGRGYGCDGVFLDNVDTTAPNSFTGPATIDQSEFEWTAPGYLEFVTRIRDDYPNKLVVQNRGLFFFDPGFEHFAFSTREQIHYLKFEEYRLDADPSREFDTFFFADNKFNTMPKLRAEADRFDGFQILSLGYAEGPGIDTATLTGDSTQGMQTLLDEITETHEVAGYRHYLTDAGGTLVNSFVRDNADFDDQTPPAWTSTYNASAGSFPTLPAAPAPRVGIQQIVGGIESLQVRWDVATDLNPVRYVAWISTEQFDFSRAQPFAGARAYELQTEVGFGYAAGASPVVFPYEATITGLAADSDYWVCIRAVDSVGNFDTNEVQMVARVRPEPIDIQIDGQFEDWSRVPVAVTDRQLRNPSAGPDWREIHVVNDDEFVYVYFTSWDSFQLDGSPRASSSRTSIFVDVDDNPFTGFRLGRVGSELVVIGDELRRQSRGVFNGGTLEQLGAAPLTQTQALELAIPISRIDEAAGGQATQIRLLFLSLDNGDVAPSRGHYAYTISR